MSSRAHISGSLPIASDRPRMLVVGAGPGYRALQRELQDLNGTGPEIVGQLASVVPGPGHPWAYLGDLDGLAELLTPQRISDVAVCLDRAELSRVSEIARTCSERGIRMSIPVPKVQAVGWRSIVERRTKRALDISGATVGLILAMPVLVIAALAILVIDGRPVFFRQLRAGIRGRPFMILKYRTMQPDADGLRDRLRSSNEISGAAFKMEGDPRVTRIGRWLRRTSIDELPQLWNVLRGEMSLVGPRPHPYDDIARYDPWHLRRLSVTPGLTGLWQVELRGDVDFDKWVAKDIEYIDHWSVWLDIKLIARTIPAVLRGTGR